MKSVSKFFCQKESALPLMPLSQTAACAGLLSRILYVTICIRSIRKEFRHMKLAEALVQRADIQKRLAQLRNRLTLNARVQEGEAPAEDPYLLLKELDSSISQLEVIITRINKTNAETIDGDKSMTALLAKRDCLRIQADIMREFLEEASATVMRGTKSEVVVKSSVSVAELQKQTDAASKELRDLDIRIQSLNWTTELL